MRARRIAVVVLLTLATLLGTCAILGVWAQRQALDTHNWVSTSDRLLQNERIRTAVALFLVDRLYRSAAVEQRMREVLPPRLDRLAKLRDCGALDEAEFQHEKSALLGS
jgi:hypothetical protein